MDILFFAAVAVFIFFKLREQLGKTDQDHKRESIKYFIKEQAKIQKQNQNQPNGQTNGPNQINNFQGKAQVIAIPGVGIVVTPIDEKSQKIISTLDDTTKINLESALQKAQLTPAHFLDGAKSAFEIIISSFSTSDLSTLKPLLSERIFAQFSAAIADRKSKNEILNTKIISIDESKITGAKIENSFATITIAFKSKQINYVENDKGEIIVGNKTEINTVNDIWTFKKDCNSQNPNWTVVVTQ